MKNEKITTKELKAWFKANDIQVKSLVPQHYWMYGPCTISNQVGRMILYNALTSKGEAVKVGINENLFNNELKELMEEL